MLSTCDAQHENTNTRRPDSILREFSVNILFPIFALIALTLFVMLRLAYLRYTAVVSKKVDPKYYTAYQGEEPVKLAVTSRHLINLMETPVLFYLACIVAYISNQAGSTVVLLAWFICCLKADPQLRSPG